MTKRRLVAVPAPEPTAVGYVRVSMAREEMISPELQAGHLRDHEARTGLRILDVVEDLDISGRSFTRAGIQRIIKGVEDGLWQVVLVYRYDRFGRNVRHSLINIAKVEEAGGRVVSVTEPFDATTAIGKYGRTNILAVAELQSDLIGEGWKSTHAHRLARGLPHSGRPRFGYVYADGAYEPDPETGPYLLEMYERFARGDSVRSIARWLNEVDVRTTRNGQWTAITVYRLLDAGFGAGLLWSRAAEGHVPGAHEPLIDRRLWERYLTVRRQGRRQSPWSRAAAHTLSGLLRCECGSTMTCGRVPGRVPGEWRRQYRCASHGSGKLCRGSHIEASIAERAVRTWVDGLAGDLEQAARAAALRVEAGMAARQDRAHWSRLVARYDGQLVQLNLDRAGGLMPDTAAFLAARDDITGRRDKALAHLEDATDEVEVLSLSHRPLITSLSRSWDELDVQARRDALRRLLRRVEVNRVDSGLPRIEIVPVWERDSRDNRA